MQKTKHPWKYGFFYLIFAIEPNLLLGNYRKYLLQYYAIFTLESVSSREAITNIIFFTVSTLTMMFVFFFLSERSLDFLTN